MKLTTGILVLGMAAGTAWGQNPDVIENTLRIADEVSVAFEKKYQLPSFPLPSGITSENDLLTTLATQGATARYGDPLPAHVRAALTISA